MPVYDRSGSTEHHEIDRWRDGFGWQAHSEEDGERVSHAIHAEGSDGPSQSAGVWVIDPGDAPALDEGLAELGDVVGVVVLCSHHARDAGEIALRHDVPVHVPTWMERVEERVDAPVEWFERTFGNAGFEICRRGRPSASGLDPGAVHEQFGTNLRLFVGAMRS